MIIQNWITPLLSQITLPVKMTLIRIAPRALDDDNLAYGLKSHRDCICDLIRPGMAPGRADGDSLVKVKYMQNKGKPKEYALKIIFEPLNKDEND